MTAENKGDEKAIRLFRVWKTAMIALFILGVLFILFIYVFLDPIVRRGIIRGVDQSTDGLYHLQINELNAHFWTGAISMNGVWLRPDSAQLRGSPMLNTDTSIPDVNLYFDSVNISTIKWFRYLLNREKLEIGKVLIKNPDFIIHGHLNGQKSVRLSDRNFLDLLPGIIAAFTGSLRIEELQVTDGLLHYDLYGKEGVIHQLADNIFINLQAIRIDTSFSQNALYSDKAFINLQNYKLITPDNLNSLHIKKASGIVHDSLLTVEKVYFSQKDSIHENYKDAIEISLEKFESRGVNYGSLLKDQKIFFRTVNVYSPNVKLHSSEDPIRKYNEPEKEKKDSSILDQVAPYLSESFTIDTLKVTNGTIFYEIRTPLKHMRQSAGKIFLTFSRVLLDTVSSPEKKKVYAEDMFLSMKDFQVDKDTTSQFRLGSLKASLKDSFLIMKTIEFTSTENGRYRFTSEDIDVGGVDYRKMLEKKEADFRFLSINSPDVFISAIRKPAEVSKSNAAEPAFKEALGPLADASLKADRFIIRNGSVAYESKGPGGRIEQRAQAIDLEVKEVYIDSSSAETLHFFEAISLGIKKYQLKVHKDNFQLSIGNIKAASEKEQIFLNDIRMTQITSFADTQRYYFTKSIRTGRVYGFDYDRFISKQELHARGLDLDRMSLKLFLDAVKAQKPEYAHRMPNEMMARLNFYVRIDSINVRNSEVEFTNQEIDVTEPGLLTFKDLNFGISNFTNDKCLMTDSTPAIIRGKTLIMGDGLLQTSISLPLLSDSFNASIYGTLDEMAGASFNSVLAFGGIRVEEGKILPSRFNVNITNGNAQGALEFVYRDLKIKLLDENEEATKRVRSKLANAIVKNHNPNDREEDPERVPLTAQRNEEDSFFNFIWRTVREGIVETVTKSTLYNLTGK